MPGSDGLRSRFRDSPEPSALPGWSCREGAGCAANCGDAVPGCAGSDGSDGGERGDSTIALGGTAVQLVACPPTTRLRVSLMLSSVVCMYNVCTAVQN